MPNLRKIKDPIYGYVYYSELEEKIISHKLVLRLHYIRQNGAAYLTYPSMRVHRFEHSLGAMHVAGSILKHALEVSEDGIDACISSIVKAITKKTVEEIKTEIERGNSGLQIFKNDGFYTYNCLQDIDQIATFGRLLIFQAVRVAALVHDIGHPPFSHTLETALKQNRNIVYPNHEEVGLDLLKLIVDDIRASETDSWYYFANAVLALTDAIIRSSNEHAWRVKGLGKIISGDIDADRLDYVRRDTLSAGSNTTAYDLGRLIDSVKLRCEHSRTHKGKYLALVITADALSTIEAFFAVRFHLYRWMLWHHNVIRLNVALFLTVKLIVKLQDSPIADIKNISKSFIELATDSDRRKDYWRFTDYYFLDMLVGMLEALETHKSRVPVGPKGEPYLLLMRYLDTFLFRHKLHLKPLWKRPDDYVRFAEIVVGSGKDDGSSSARRFNKRLKDKYRQHVRNEASKARVNVNDRREIERFERSRVDYLSGSFCTTMEKHFFRHLPNADFRVRAYYLAKFRAAPEGLKLHDRDNAGDGGIDLDLLSPSVAALRDAWEALPQLWLLVENLPGVDISTSAADRRSRQEFYNPVGKALKAFLKAPSEVSRP